MMSCGYKNTPFFQWNLHIFYFLSGLISLAMASRMSISKSSENKCKIIP